MKQRKSKRRAGERVSNTPPRSASSDGELRSLFATAIDLHKSGHLQQAALLYKTILSVDAHHADSLHLLGTLSHHAGNYEEACELIGAAIASNARVPQYHFNRGVSLQALLRLHEAADAYRQAALLQPDYREAYENLGVALQDLHELTGAADAYARALLLDPASAIANQNLGTLLGNLGRTAEARAHFATVLDRHPIYGEAHTKRAWMLLLDGDFEAGWPEYEWRQHSETFVANNPVRAVPFPKWDGGPLADKTILINPEQGIGDEIMFASCYRDVLAAARHCVIESDPRLVTVFARSFPEATVIAGERSAHFRWSADLPAIDYRIPAGSLPGFYRTRLEDFPQHAAYLVPDPNLQAQWRAKLTALDRPLNIGISWRGGREARSAAARSIALHEWRSVLDFAGANFVSLQYGDHVQEIAALEREHAVRLHTLDGLDALTDLEELIALISALDLVISIDNSTVFMAGAVGTPVWILLPSSGEWRWLKQRSTSPWHPSATLFRQQEPGVPAWRDVLESVANRLGPHFESAAAANAARAVTAGAARATGGEQHATALARAELGERSVPRQAPRLAGAPQRTGAAVFLNDTAHWYHFGCSCTSLAIHAELRSQWASVESLPIHKITQLKHLPVTIDAFDDAELFTRFAAAYGDMLATLAAADVVYVNGEGTLHNAAPQALGLLYLVYVASTRLNRAVHVINHSCYPDDTAALSDNFLFSLYKKVYEKLAFVAVRESVSATLVAQMGIPATASFDCLPLFVARYFRPGPKRRSKDILIAGSVYWGGMQVIPALVEYIRRMHAAGFNLRVLVGANAYIAADDFVFVDALRAACGEYFTVVNATSELQWLQTIADSALLVSGRFHHTLAAAFVGTPFIVMESNTPKIQGIMAMLRSNAFVSVAEPALADVLVERSQQYIEHSGDIVLATATKEHLLELARLNFRARESR